MDLCSVIDQLFYESESNNCDISIDFSSLYCFFIESVESNYLSVKLWAHILHTYIIKILQTINSLNDNDTEDLYDILNIEKDRMINDFAYYIIKSLINSSIPGALTILSKANVLQLYQQSIDNFMTNNVSNGIYNLKNPIALSLYLDSIWKLLPYLQDRDYYLNDICHRFHCSNLWISIWNSVVDLDYKNPNPEIDMLNVRVMFIKFLRLSSGLIYGLRGNNFIAHYNEDKNHITWNYIFKILYNSTISHIIASKIYKYIADLLLISYADKSLKIFLKFQSSRLKNVLEVNISKFSQQGNNVFYLESNDPYQSKCCVQIRAIYSLFKNGVVDKTLKLLHKISSLNDVILAPSNEGGTIDYFADKMIPRILPCFNTGCNNIFHMDNPEVHLSSSVFDFKYCDM